MEQIAQLERRAAELLASVVDGMDVADARKIEAEHKQVCEQITQMRRSYIDRRAAEPANNIGVGITVHDGGGQQGADISEILYSKLTNKAPSERARPLAYRSVTDLMRMTLETNGHRTFDLSPAGIIDAAWATRSGPGFHSTSDFPVLLGNVMGRRLGELFTAAESGASAIVATGTARDFRAITEARMTSFPSLEHVNESGEITWGTMDEEGERLAIASYARGISISFQALINDDLNAIERSLRDIAFATAQLKAKLIIAALGATLSDGNPLFHSAHKNLAGSGAGPDESTLSTGRTSMLKQTPPGSNEPLGISPAIFFVPAELQTNAEKLVTAIQATATSDVNVFGGKLQVAVEPRLTDAKAWYLFASPSTYPVLRFLTLQGFEAPRLETQQEFNRLGSSYRVHWHCGAGPVDHRGAWKNPGQ